MRFLELEEMFNKSIGTKGTKYYHGMNGFENIIGELLGDDDIVKRLPTSRENRDIYNQYKVIGKVFMMANVWILTNICNV